MKQDTQKELITFLENEGFDIYTEEKRTDILIRLKTNWSPRMISNHTLESFGYYIHALHSTNTIRLREE